MEGAAGVRALGVRGALRAADRAALGPPQAGLAVAAGAVALIAAVLLQPNDDVSGMRSRTYVGGLTLPFPLPLTQVHGVAGERPPLNSGSWLSWLLRGAGMKSAPAQTQRSG